ncbi:MAG TPA: DUF2933 domain-containing protein [Burkholderiales bacterium]|nr:DUF2933 domain-containing protein [Burkholderiales bacterium]
MNSHGNGNSGGRGKWILLGFAAIAAYFLWTEHQAHAIQYLPVVLLLACPLMHFFHHGGHAPHKGDERQDPIDRHRHRDPQVRS